jgi:hypothetical protein
MNKFVAFPGGDKLELSSTKCLLFAFRQGYDSIVEGDHPLHGDRPIQLRHIATGGLKYCGP